jgi:co-chaperonin GroES (HSP10)
MLFIPLNKLVLIERVHSPKKTKSVGGFVVPEESMQSRYCVVKVLRCSDLAKSDLMLQEGDLVVAQTALIDEIQFDEQKFLVISENGIVARLQESDF